MAPALLDVLKDLAEGGAPPREFRWSAWAPRHFIEIAR
jgi:hypothetical protein